MRPRFHKPVAILVAFGQSRIFATRSDRRTSQSLADKSPSIISLSPLGKASHQMPLEKPARVLKMSPLALLRCVVLALVSGLRDAESVISTRRIG